MTFSSRFKLGLVSLSLFAAISQDVQAVEVAGVIFDDTAKVASKDLMLNGAGIRFKGTIFKLYVAGLYLTEKKTTPADVLAVDGPKRMMLVMMREMNSVEFGESFMRGLNENSDKAERLKYVHQIMAFGEIIASVDEFKKGDILSLDWIPGTGLVSTLNDKKMGQPIQDPGFYNILLKIWLGEKPVDSLLKAALLGDES